MDVGIAVVVFAVAFLLGLLTGMHYQLRYDERLFYAARDRSQGRATDGGTDEA